MNKIYLVKCYNQFDEYRNFKAFVNKENAEAYAKELDIKHSEIPNMPDGFEEVFEEACSKTPDWINIPDYRFEKEAYFKYVEEHEKEDNQIIIDFMRSKGFEISDKELEDFKDWKYNTWEDSEIEEVELCE